MLSVNLKYLGAPLLPLMILPLLIVVCGWVIEILTAGCFMIYVKKFEVLLLFPASFAPFLSF